MPKVEIDFIGNDMMGGAISSAASLITGLSSAIGLVEKGLGYAQKAYDLTAGAAMDYANTVRALSLTSGESAESTSRFIQLLDDYRLTAEDATAATKALTKSGLAPNIETLAKLSDEFLSLTNIEDKNAFVIKNLGRAGLEWNQILGQGSQALKDQAAAVNGGLILSQRQLDAAEKLRLQQDMLNDSWDAIKVSIGNNVIPALSALVDAELDTIRAREIMLEQGIAWSSANRNAINKAMDQARAEREAAAAIDTTSVAMAGQGKSADDLAAQQKALTDAINATTAANNGMLGLIGSVKSENDNYAKSMVDLQGKNGELQTSLQTLKDQGWWPTSEAVLDATNKLNDNEQAIKDLELTHEAAMKKIAWNLLVTKLQADGFTDAEYKVAIQAGITAGVLDEKSAAMAVAMNETANKAVIAADKITGIGTAVQMLPNGKVITVTVKALSDRLDLIGERRNGLATGGVSPGGMTLVGERGPELVNLPGGSRVYSNQDTRGMMGGGTTVNLNIASGGIIADPQEFARQITPALKFALRDMGVR